MTGMSLARALVAAVLVLSGCGTGTSTVVLSDGSSTDGGLEVSLDREHTDCDPPPEDGDRSCSVVVDLANTGDGPRNVVIDSVEMMTVDGTSYPPSEPSSQVSVDLAPGGETAAVVTFDLPPDAEPSTVTVLMGSATVTFVWPG